MLEKRNRSISLQAILIACLLFIVSCKTREESADTSRFYRIGIVHSYEKSYHDADRYRRLLVRELEARGIPCEVKELFLNCDELTYYDEMARASFFIDELTRWGADAVALFNNQASYSLLKCGNPALRRLPVVFGGVYHPDTELIGSYPNVTGFVDIPDYTRTVRMIERIMGTSRIVMMSGSGMIDQQMWDLAKEQCQEAGIATFDGDVFDHIWAHRVIKDPYKEDKKDFYNERIDTTVVVRMLSETMPLRTIQQMARGSETYLMLASRTYNSMDADEFFANPSFAVINEGFGSRRKMLGGYFTPLEDQLRAMAGQIALRIRGGMPERQITQLGKRYVLNWKVMQRSGIGREGLPTEYEVMYIPFAERYRILLLAVAILLGAVLIAAFFYLLHSLARERRRKREALRNLLYEHETLKLAFEGGGATYAWRMQGGSVRFDSHFYRMIGYEAKSITPGEILAFIHPDDRERFRSSFLREETPTRHKEEYRANFGGTYEWWELRYSYVLVEGHAPVVTGLLQNIQEVKDREAELIRTRQIAERAELKQSFLNNMSHEIRTPLNAIVGFSNLLVTTPDLSEEEKSEFVRTINHNNSLLLNLIDDILELSRIESGSAPFALREENLRTLLDTYYQTFSVQKKPDLLFETDFPDEEVTVRVDPLRLQQVINNFLTNANKFTERGCIRLGYRLSENGREVRIFVEDSGKGIPAEELEMIFTRFYKRDEFAQGTGLGLAISRSIADRMNGRIEVQSREGMGSRFTVVLPTA